MASFNYRNENYRDELIKFSYPFDEQSDLESGDLFIGTDLDFSSPSASQSSSSSSSADE